MSVFDGEHLLPLWVRDPATRRATARKARADAGPAARRVARGLPRWAGLYLWHVLVGLGRVTAAVTGWIVDQDSAQLQREHAGRTETDAYVKVQAARRAHLHARLLVAVARGGRRAGAPRPPRAGRGVGAGAPGRRWSAGEARRDP